MSLRQYLVAVSVALVVLLCGAAAILLLQVDRFARNQAERQLLQTTAALSLALDAELARYESLLHALRASGAVERGDWAAVDRQARQVLAGPNAWIVVAERSGQQVVNTRLPPGATLPRGALAPDVWRRLDRGQTHICNLSTGLVERRILCVDVPIIRGERATHHMSVVFRPSQIGELVRRQQIQRDAFTTVLDASQRVVWRNVALDRFLGRPAGPDINEALKSADDGVRESISLEGVPTVAAFSRSPQTGWTFVIGVPRLAMRASAGTTLAGGSVAVLALLVIGAIIGLFAASKIDRAVRRLGSIADPQASGVRFEGSGLTDVDAVGHALSDARDALQKSEERYRRVFEQTSDMILTADLDQIITDCNPAAAEAVGLSRKEVIGRAISEFVSNSDFERTSSMLRRKIERGGTTRYDVRVKSRSGEWLDWEINSGLILDPGGNPVGLHVVGRDITERRRAEERQQLLVNELNHRVKNTLAIVQSLAYQSFKNLPDGGEAPKAFEARLNALAAAHNLLTRERWEKATLEQTLKEAVAATAGPRARQVTLSGPEIALLPQTAVSIAMAAHELATNAIKYGALARDDGRIHISWAVANGEAAPRLHLEWREEGGPEVRPPERRGFGSRLIERGLAAELGGTVKLDFAAEGLVCRVDAPLPREPEAIGE